MNREDLLKSPEFWILEIQMKLHDLIIEYLEKHNLTRKQLADRLGFSKSYITQILNGEFDHRISKLVEIAISIGKVPKIEYEEVEQILIDDLYGKLYAPKEERPVINLYHTTENICTIGIENSHKQEGIIQNSSSNNNFNLHLGNTFIYKTDGKNCEEKEFKYA